MGIDDARMTEIYYERVFNLGNYESARVGAKVALPEDLDPQDAMDQLKAWVLKQQAKNGGKAA